MEYTEVQRNYIWIKSNEQEPLNEGKYFCKYNNVKLVLDFVKNFKCVIKDK